MELRAASRDLASLADEVGQATRPTGEDAPDAAHDERGAWSPWLDDDYRPSAAAPASPQPPVDQDTTGDVAVHHRGGPEAAAG